MTTPRKLTIAALILLVCGVVVALLVRAPKSKLVLTLKGLERNVKGVLTATIVVSNAGPHTVLVNVSSKPGPTRPDDIELTFPHTAVLTIPVPIEKAPCRVFVEVFRPLSNNISDHVRFFLANHVSRGFYLETATLDIP